MRLKLKVLSCILCMRRSGVYDHGQINMTAAGIVQNDRIRLDGLKKEGRKRISGLFISLPQTGTRGSVNLDSSPKRDVPWCQVVFIRAENAPLSH